MSAPAGFLFAVKASRYLTHMKKLKDPADSLLTFLGRADELENKLGPILFQLPPRWKLDVERLRSFLQALPQGRLFAFEFREETWYDERVYEALSEHNAALCVHDLRGHASPRVVIADWVYVRLHGPDGAYSGKYSSEALAGWATTFSAWMSHGKQVYCYFNNDMAGYAAENALTMRHIVEG